MAGAEPAVMCELGRWCENPFVLLEHMSEQGIKNWMEGKRQQHCLSNLSVIVDEISDVAAKTVLHEWIDGMRTGAERITVRTTIRDVTKWEMLKIYAGAAIKGPLATRFVTRDYTRMSAYVLVLEELFPELAYHVLAAEPSHEYKPTDTLIDAYRHSAPFRLALATATKQQSWDPVGAYMTQLDQRPTTARAVSHC